MAITKMILEFVQGIAWPVAFIIFALVIRSKLMRK